MGNCLFESLNFFLKEKNNLILREKLVQYIKSNGELFEKDIIHNRHKSVENYCEQMKKNGRDGDGIVLQACVLLYQIKVIVYFRNASNPLVIEPIKEAEAIVQLKYTPGHYSVYKQLDEI